MARSLVLALLLALAAPAGAQVMVAPTFVALDADRGVGTITILNRGATVQEVEVAFRFGYSVADSAGGWVVRYEDEGPIAEAHSVDAWVRAFPRRFVLEPGARQAVRVMARPPAGLPDGTYWTRLITRSTEQAPLLARTSDVVSARVDVTFEQTVPFVVRKGTRGTSLQAGPGTARLVGDRVRLTLPVTRDGMDPFFGTLAVRVVDAAGVVVHEFERSSAVYFDFVERVDLSTSSLSPGRYRATVTFRSGRGDIPVGRLPSMDPVSVVVPFSVPPSE